VIEDALTIDRAGELGLPTWPDQVNASTVFVRLVPQLVTGRLGGAAGQ